MKEGTLNLRKIISTGALATVVLGGAALVFGAGSAGATTVPGPNLGNYDTHLDTGISHAVNCVVGVTTHGIDYKWVPNVSAAGPTMWTVDNASADTQVTFTWKGAQVGYHRDGNKTQPAIDTQCGDIYITNQGEADQLMAQYSTSRNMDVPQGADVQLRWFDFKGTLSVEGKLSLASSQIEKDAVVSGPGAGLSLFNEPGNHFWSNLTVNAAGGYYDGSGSIYTALGLYSGGQQVDGNLAFTNNTGVLKPSGAINVNGTFTYSGNAAAYRAGYCFRLGHPVRGSTTGEDRPTTAGPFSASGPAAVFYGHRIQARWRGRARHRPGSSRDGQVHRQIGVGNLLAGPAAHRLDHVVPQEPQSRMLHSDVDRHRSVLRNPLPTEIDARRAAFQVKHLCR